jgi:hypothetical protein
LRVSSYQQKIKASVILAVPSSAENDTTSTNFHHFALTLQTGENGSAGQFLYWRHNCQKWCFQVQKSLFSAVNSGNGGFLPIIGSSVLNCL